MTSFSSVSVSPFCRARSRWPGSCSVLPPVMSAATVIRLRSRGDSSVRAQMSPNSTSSVKDTSFGAKSPISCWARVWVLRSVLIRVLRFVSERRLMRRSEPTSSRFCRRNHASGIGCRLSSFTSAGSGPPRTPVSSASIAASSSAVSSKSKTSKFSAMRSGRPTSGWPTALPGRASAASTCAASCRALGDARRWSGRRACAGACRRGRT